MPESEPTVLVVEDDESFVDALTVGLAGEGFNVAVARDGVDALDALDECHPTSCCST